MLKISGLSKKINTSSVLNDIFLTVKEGEIFGLLGPNGSGKTTLIKCIVGLIRPDSGSIQLNGLHISTSFEKAISSIGAIVENPEFYEYMTGRDHLKMAAAFYPAADSDRMKEVIELVNLGKAIDDRVSTYSLGMKQRLGIAGAVLHKPKLLILDEPQNGLDPAGMIELRTYIKLLQKNEGTTIICTSHLLNEMEDLCDRVAILKSGSVIHIHQLKQEGSSRIFIKAEPFNKARKLLSTHFSTIQKENGLYIAANAERIPEITRLLVANSLEVYSIYPVKKSLEEAFLEVTEGRVGE